LEKIKREAFNMRRSKLEMYIDILKVLAQRGPLKLTHIMYKANVNCSVLKEYLDFLIEQELVEEKTVGKKRIVYVVSEKGLKVLKYFRELKVMLPVVEEGQARMPASLY
jgi:predicted transcriptional regulator